MLLVHFHSMSRDAIPTLYILHAYQPFNQSEDVLKRIVERCYLPFLRGMLGNENIKVNFNFSGILLELLESRFPEVISLLNELIDRQQIELLGSAYYHPLLPLIDSDDQRAQINLQTSKLKELFGFTPSSFFPPELAISQSVLDALLSNNFSSVIVPENLFLFSSNASRYSTSSGSIVLLKRNKAISNGISFNSYKGNVEHVIGDLRNTWKNTGFPPLIAMDLETYGEHLPHYYNFFFELAGNTSTLLLSELLNNYSVNEEIHSITPSSWSTSDEDQRRGIYFPLWDHPSNSIHQLLQLHLGLLKRAKVLIKKENPDCWADFYKSYLKASYSCQFWWASHFWSKDLVLQGLKFQRQVLERMCSALSSTSRSLLLDLSSELLSRLHSSVAVRDNS